MWRKACPKCGGNLYVERQVGGGADVSCLQCAKVLTPREIAVLLLKARERRQAAMAMAS